MAVAAYADARDSSEDQEAFRSADPSLATVDPESAPRTERTGIKACRQMVAVRLGWVTLMRLPRGSAAITTRSQPLDSVRSKIRSKAPPLTEPPSSTPVEL